MLLCAAKRQVKACGLGTVSMGMADGNGTQSPKLLSSPASCLCACGKLTTSGEMFSVLSESAEKNDAIMTKRQK